MNFVFNIAVHDQPNDKIQLAISQVMETWGYKIAPEQLAEYQGHPSILANLLGVAEDKVAKRLLKSRNDSSIFAHDEMSEFLEEDLGIEDWYKSYLDLVDDLDQLQDWDLLIFSKCMTDAELQWCKMEISQAIMPGSGPPIWINQ